MTRSTTITVTTVTDISTNLAIIAIKETPLIAIAMDINLAATISLFTFCNVEFRARHGGACKGLGFRVGVYNVKSRGFGLQGLKA